MAGRKQFVQRFDRHLRTVVAIIVRNAAAETDGGEIREFG
jgi:hypothetical protein